LISDLSTGVRVIAAVAGVDDLIAIVLIILVPTGQDDGIGSLRGGA
jgi:hypothetical protein